MRSYYLLQLLAVLLWWLLVRLTTRKYLWDTCNSSVVTRPSWLPMGGSLVGGVLRLLKSSWAIELPHRP